MIRTLLNSSTQTSSKPLQLQQADLEPGIQEIYSQLAADEDRTARIVADVVSAVQAGRSPLVLTERTEHLDRLAGLLDGQVHHVLVLRVGVGATKRVVEIYDYVDAGVPMMVAMCKKRLRGYEEIGYSVAGEVPGLDTASQRRRYGRDAARR